MARYLLKRALNYFVLIVIATTATYFLAASALNPELNFDRTNPRLSWDAVQASLTSLHINPNDPILERFWHWVKGVVLHWDWGRNPNGGYVTNEISSRIWVSVRLVLIGSLLGAGIGITVGAWQATRQYKASDHAITLWALVMISTPTAVIAVVLQILATQFNRRTGWNWFEFLGETGTHSGGWISPWLDRLQHLLLPTITLTIGGIAGYSRYQRSLMLDTLGADYVRTARAKGLRRRKAVFKHALRTALIPTGTLFAFEMATIFVGATFTETLFGWHGMGEYLIESLLKNDVNGTVAVTTFSAVCVLAGAILSEVFVVVLDPRVRVS